MLAMPVLDVARILTRLCSNAIPFLPRGPFREVNRMSEPGGLSRLLLVQKRLSPKTNPGNLPAPYAAGQSGHHRRRHRWRRRVSGHSAEWRADFFAPRSQVA